MANEQLHTPSTLPPPNVSGYALDRRLVGLLGWYGRDVEEKNRFLCRKTKPDV
jgi:hypothetical protein